MSDEDSLSEMNATPARLMPKSSSLAEHHRILGLSAVHAGNTIATLKAHKVRHDNLEERLEEIEDVKDTLWGLKADMASQREVMRDHMEQVSKSLTSQGDVIGKIGQTLAENKTNSEIKKMVVAGVISIALAITTAYCGYTFGHQPTTKYEAPTHQQAIEIDRKIQSYDPNNVRHENRPPAE